MSLIQNYISTVNQPRPQVNVAQESQAHDEKLQVGDYIDQYAKTNESQAKHICSIWDDVQHDLQKYSYLRVEEVLENSIKQESQQVLIKLANNFVGFNTFLALAIGLNFKPVILDLTMMEIEIFFSLALL